MLHQELALGMTAYHLVLSIRRLAASPAGVPARKRSFTGTWSLVRVLLLDNMGLSDEESASRFALVLCGSTPRQIPTRPGRKRSTPATPQGPKTPQPSTTKTSTNTEVRGIGAEGPRMRVELPGTRQQGADAPPPTNRSGRMARFIVLCGDAILARSARRR